MIGGGDEGVQRRQDRNRSAAAWHGGDLVDNGVDWVVSDDGVMLGQMGSPEELGLA